MSFDKTAYQKEYMKRRRAGELPLSQQLQAEVERLTIENRRLQAEVDEFKQYRIASLVHGRELTDTEKREQFIKYTEQRSKELIAKIDADQIAADISTDAMYVMASGMCDNPLDMDTTFPHDDTVYRLVYCAIDDIRLKKRTMILKEAIEADKNNKIEFESSDGSFMVRRDGIVSNVHYENNKIVWDKIDELDSNKEQIEKPKKKRQSKSKKKPVEPEQPKVEGIADECQNCRTRIPIWHHDKTQMIQALCDGRANIKDCPGHYYDDD